MPPPPPPPPALLKGREGRTFQILSHLGEWGPIFLLERGDKSEIYSSITFTVCVWEKYKVSFIDESQCLRFSPLDACAYFVAGKSIIEKLCQTIIAGMDAQIVGKKMRIELFTDSDFFKYIN